MKTIKRHWLVGLIASIVIGSAVGVSAARALVGTPAPSVLADVQLPALDHMVAKLAAEARTPNTSELR